MDNYLLIGVDPGAGGGIAYHGETKETTAVKMPGSRKEIFDFFSEMKKHCCFSNQKPLVFIEKIQMFHSDSDTGGKQFGIMKLLANFETLQTVFEILELPFVLVPSQTWQKELGFKRVKGEKKAERKIKYRDTATVFFPHTKPTLQTADALCLLIFGKKKLKLDPDWINERLNQVETDLFG